MTDQSKGFARVAAVLACLCWASPVAADEVIEFVPTLRALGTRVWNIQRAPGGTSLTDDSAWYELELPVEIRGPRWTGRIAYTPIYRQQFDDLVDDQLDHQLTAELSGGWSRRTTLTLAGRLAVTPEIFGLPQGELAVPRTDLFSASARVGVGHTLSSRTSLRVAFDTTVENFSEGAFIDTQTFGLAASFRRKMSRRLEVVGQVAGQLFAFSGVGEGSRSVDPSVGVRYQLARNTGVEVLLGASILDGDLAVGDAAVSTSATEFTGTGRIDHTARNVRLGLEVTRGFGGGGGLGQPTRRTRVTGTIEYARPVWDLRGSLGASRNELILGEAGQTLLDALLPEEFAGVDRLDTVTASARANYWLHRWIGINGAYDFVYQDSLGAPAFDFDSHRVSLGVALRPWNAPPLRGGRR